MVAVDHLLIGLYMNTIQSVKWFAIKYISLCINYVSLISQYHCPTSSVVENKTGICLIPFFTPTASYITTIRACHWNFAVSNSADPTTCLRRHYW